MEKVKNKRKKEKNKNLNTLSPSCRQNRPNFNGLGNRGQ